jgi:hypothetical protein
VEICSPVISRSESYRFPSSFLKPQICDSSQWFCIR